MVQAHLPTLLLIDYCMELADITGYIGIILILLGYALGVFHTDKSFTKGYTYMAINLVGSVFSAFSAYLMDSIPFLVLNIIWFLISVHGIWKKWSNSSILRITGI